MTSPDFEASLVPLARPMPPMPNIWQASLVGALDPRWLPDAPTILEVLSPLVVVSDNPTRPAAFQRLTRHFVEQRKVAGFCFLVLRARTDRFLAMCLDAGFASPAFLPQDATLGDHRTKPLLELRSDIDDIVLACRDAFPERIKSGFQNGSATEIIEVLMEQSGCFYYSFNQVMFFAGIILLRLELYSSAGTYLTAAISGSPEDRDTIADEFAAGGALFGELLEDLITVTRILEEWRQLNPSFAYHLEPHVTMLSRVCFVHASFRRKFRCSLNGPDPAKNLRTLEVLEGIDRDILSVLNVLERYAFYSAWCRSFYNLACKVTGEQRISETDTHEAYLLVDIPNRRSPDSLRLDTEDEQIEAEAQQMKNLLTIYANSVSR